MSRPAFVTLASGFLMHDPIKPHRRAKGSGTPDQAGADGSFWDVVRRTGTA